MDIPTGKFFVYATAYRQRFWTFDPDELESDAPIGYLSDEPPPLFDRSPHGDDSDGDGALSPHSAIPICMMTTVSPNINSLILVVDDDTSEEAYSFVSKPAEFVTGNCATHHICSILGMFTSMSTADKIGV